MRVLIAPDKFKGSLTAAEVADHLAKGLAEAGASHQDPPAGRRWRRQRRRRPRQWVPSPTGGRARGDRREPPWGRRLRRRHRNRRGRQHLRAGHPARRGPRPDDRIELWLRRSHTGGAHAVPSSPGARARRKRQHRRRRRNARRVGLPLPRPERRSPGSDRREPGPASTASIRVTPSISMASRSPSPAT